MSAAANLNPSAEARSLLEREHRLLIGGQWVPSASRESIDVFNPATEVQLAKVAAGGKDDIDRAVVSARKAFRGEWSKLRGPSTNCPVAQPPAARSLP